MPLERLLEEPELAVPKRNVTPPAQPPAEEKRAAITRREEAYVPAPDDAPPVAPHVTGLDESPPASPALGAGRRLPVLVCRIDGDRLVPLAADEVTSLLQGYGRSGDLLLTGLTASTDTLPLGALLAEARERRAPTLAVLRFVDTGGQRAAELRLYRSADGALLELHSGLVPSLTALGHRLRRSLEAPSGG
ncbi:MAG: hypothetical protein D6776_11315 [Planctomycetota bacterium]|nr:MAG: hypothetical protein D6776_11315 [Planctomycetota bacterium]